jgi:hypothetical protein
MLGFLVSRRENKDDILSQIRSRSVQVRVTNCLFFQKPYAVFRIRIPIFLGLPDPDPFVRGMNADPAPDPSISKQK